MSQMNELCYEEWEEKEIRNGKRKKFYVHLEIRRAPAFRIF